LPLRLFSSGCSAGIVLASSACGGAEKDAGHPGREGAVLVGDERLELESPALVVDAAGNLVDLALADLPVLVDFEGHRVADLKGAAHGGRQMHVGEEGAVVDYLHHRLARVDELMGLGSPLRQAAVEGGAELASLQIQLGKAQGGFGALRLGLGGVPVQTALLELLKAYRGLGEELFGTLEVLFGERQGGFRLREDRLRLHVGLKILPRVETDDRVAGREGFALFEKVFLDVGRNGGGDHRLAKREKDDFDCRAVALLASHGERQEKAGGKNQAAYPCGLAHSVKRRFPGAKPARQAWPRIGEEPYFPSIFAAEASAFFKTPCLRRCSASCWIEP